MLAGRFFARIAVPVRLRPYLDSPRSELIEALGGDRRAALRAHPAAVARLQQELAAAERKASALSARFTAPLFPLTIEQMTARHYRDRLACEEELRNEVRWSSLGIDDLLVKELREAISGRLDDDRLNALVTSWIEGFRRQGNTDVRPPSAEWRKLARALCVAEYETLARVAERDDGDFSGKPDHPFKKLAARSFARGQVQVATGSFGSSVRSTPSAKPARCSTTWATRIWVR